MVKISIIVPVYNSEKYLSRCIDSILNQTMKDFELILINDGSTDNSLSILKNYELKDSRIRVIDQKNVGVSKTRNKGIKLANGDYITFIDNDDTIKSDYLEKFLSFIGDYDMVIGGYQRVDSNGNIISEFRLKDSLWAKYTFITPWARIYKKKFLIDNNIKFLTSPIGEDVYFNLNIYNKTDSIKIVNYVGYEWLNNLDSVSNTVHKGFNDKVDIVKFLDSLYSIKGDKYQDYFDFYCYKFGIWYLLYSGKNADSKKFIQEYEKIQKWNKKNNIRMNIFPFSKKLSGERLSTRLSILCFKILDDMKLISLFSKFYCKG